MTNDLTLEDLAKHSGLPLRTLRFYIQEGILQGPDTHGKYARYSQPHLDRLKLIQRLKSLRLPIQEIRRLLDNMTPEEISQIRQFQDVLNPSFDRLDEAPYEEKSISDPGSSALEYIRDLERGRKNLKTYMKPEANAAMPPLARQSPDLNENTISPRFIKKQITQKVKDQGTWKRVVIEEGIELNIREPMDTTVEEKVKKLIEMAQKLFGEK